MTNDIVIIRNVLNPDLLKSTKIEYEPQLLVDGRNGLFGQELLLKLFVENRIQDKYGFVCLIDEDCLLYDIQHMYDIISYMKENSIDIMGVPDGGMLEHRRHRPDVPNLFFVVIDTTKLKNLDWAGLVVLLINSPLYSCWNIVSSWHLHSGAQLQTYLYLVHRRIS